MQGPWACTQAGRGLERMPALLGASRLALHHVLARPPPPACLPLSFMAAATHPHARSCVHVAAARLPVCRPLDSATQHNSRHWAAAASLLAHACTPPHHPRPRRLALARVSVLRGAGPSAGLPFIDDYVATVEPVVDYLTRWSGIRPGACERRARHTTGARSAGCCDMRHPRGCMGLPRSLQQARHARRSVHASAAMRARFAGRPSSQRLLGTRCTALLRRPTQQATWTRPRRRTTWCRSRRRTSSCTTCWTRGPCSSGTGSSRTSACST